MTVERSRRVSECRGRCGGVLPDTPASGLAALPDTADGLAALYAWPERTDGPYVRANMIASLDGGTTVDGRSAGLGNAADEELFAVLRDLAEVILVGAGTVRAERYGGVLLDADRQARRERWGAAPAPPPIAVVTARGLDPDHPLFTDTVTPPIVITTRRAATTAPRGATVILAGSDELDLQVAVAELGAAGYGRIHCEGGPSLLGALASADLLDECCLTIAPMLLGSGAAPMLPVRLDEPARWSLRNARMQGDHLFTRYRRVRAV
jgi:riboflavin biosynthesis pyrimidine reductase